ncbi:DUF6959 family protein [Sphingorhabdus sp. Alg231-15]|uniref:DUF6959 family protein n=1 Tax=Sphingorhabdus sp. Alg231-15 TaxID=1922222 RepID=UPI00307BBEE6
MSDVKLLSRPTNYAVVQLPGRQFPGVVFQGDSLNILICELAIIAAEKDPAEKSESLENVMDRLLAVQGHYEATLEEAGIKLPY